MVLITQSGPETLPIGSPAPDFSNLPSVDGHAYSLSDFSDASLLVLSFTCNHCPYAKAYEDRFTALANEFMPKGVGFLAINSNDVVNYPQDDLAHMKERAREKGFPFAYVRDDDQTVARAYGAVCTPHLFVLDGERKLAYEGRIDDNWQHPEQATAHDLRDALNALLAGQQPPQPQTNPMGCSIKWLAD
jgi:peroxiredoxin